MTSVIHRSIITMALAAVVALIAFFDAGSAQAQQCTSNTITLVNNTTCNLEITFIATSGVSAKVFGIAPGVSNHTFPAGFFPAGIVTALGNFFGFPPVGGPCTACLSFVDASGIICCVSICRTAPCTLVLNPISPCLASCN